MPGRARCWRSRWSAGATSPACWSSTRAPGPASRRTSASSPRCSPSCSPSAWATPPPDPASRHVCVRESAPSSPPQPVVSRRPSPYRWPEPSSGTSIAVASVRRVTVPTTGEPTVVLDARAELGECPVWAGDEQALYWVDIRGKALHRFDPATGADRAWPLPQQCGSFALRESGGAVLALVDGFYAFDFA